MRLELENRGAIKKKKGKNILFDPSIPPCLLQMSGLFYLLVNYRRGEIPGGTKDSENSVAEFNYSGQGLMKLAKIN